MSSAFAETGQPMAIRLRRLSWVHPEWWSVALCGFAWTTMLLHGARNLEHGIHHRMTFTQELQQWLLMVAAMMLPFLVHAIRQTAEGSLWARRHRAIAGLLVGYFAPWLTLGIIVAGLREVSWTHTYTASALGFVAAALWRCTPMHRRSLLACHRRLPLAPVGWQADRDCLRFGGIIGAACVGSCWPLMVACTFAGHSPVAMAGGMALGVVERWSFWPRPRTLLIGTLSLAAYYAVLAGMDHAFGPSPR